MVETINFIFTPLDGTFYLKLFSIMFDPYLFFEGTRYFRFSFFFTSGMLYILFYFNFKILTIFFFIVIVRKYFSVVSLNQTIVLLHTVVLKHQVKCNNITIFYYCLWCVFLFDFQHVFVVLSFPERHDAFITHLFQDT